MQLQFPSWTDAILGHGSPSPYVVEQNGGKQTLWTTLELTDISSDDLGVFLCDYEPILFQTYGARDINERRRYLEGQLRELQGGPLGVQSLQKIIIGLSKYQTATPTWQKLSIRMLRRSRSGNPLADLKFNSCRLEGPAFSHW